MGTTKEAASKKYIGNNLPNTLVSGLHCFMFEGYLDLFSMQLQGCYETFLFSPECFLVCMTV